MVHFDLLINTISIIALIKFINVHLIVEVVKVNFGFAMIDMVLAGGSKCTKIPFKSAYLRELGLSFTKQQKLLKSVQ